MAQSKASEQNKVVGIDSNLEEDPKTMSNHTSAARNTKKSANNSRGSRRMHSTHSRPERNVTQETQMIGQPSASDDKDELQALDTTDDVTGEVKAKNSQSLKIKVALSDDEVVESEKVIVQEHSIFVDGTKLSERREIENVQDGKSTIRHTRRIDDRQYTVVEKRERGQIRSSNIDTLMTPEEFSAFQSKWRIMWHPDMSEDQILDLVHEEGLTTDTETNTEVRDVPGTEQTTLEKSRLEPEHGKEEKRKRFWWCCC